MGGFFGSVKKSSAVFDVFLGTDYHSHLGTKRGGMAAYDSTVGLQREIHNIENAPFRTKFERVLSEMKGYRLYKRYRPATSLNGFKARNICYMYRRYNQQCRRAKKRVAFKRRIFRRNDRKQGQL